MPPPANSHGWRLLGLYWAAIASLTALTAGVLAFLGPPTTPSSTTARRAPDTAASVHAGIAIPPPDPLLLEPAPDFPGHSLPRIGLAGRRPGQYYAAHSNAADPQAKIALIVAGIGLNRADSLNAASVLPRAVTFAVSAYADHPEPVLDAVRAAGHETLLSLPMEPAGFPADDEGDHELLTGATPAENSRNLQWALSRITGYTGVTGASDGLRGERFAASPALMAPVGEELARRGLFYIDPRPPAEAPDTAFGRTIDLVIDRSEVPDDIDSRLAELEQAARLHGSAIGLVGHPSPVAIARIDTWLARLPTDGISLIPVSGLMQPPAPP